jgi:hypothetical protein
MPIPDLKELMEIGDKKKATLTMYRQFDALVGDDLNRYLPMINQATTLEELIMAHSLLNSALCRHLQSLYSIDLMLVDILAAKVSPIDPATGEILEEVKIPDIPRCTCEGDPCPAEYDLADLAE